LTVEPAQAPSAPLPAAPPSISISFSPTTFPERLNRALASGQFESFHHYRLRVEAEQLRLLGGLDQLLPPEQSRIRTFEHQVRTAQIALRRMRGRALLSDEVGLGKTIEAGLILKEYLLRGMVSKVLILAVPALINQWQEELLENSTS